MTDESTPSTHPLTGGEGADSAPETAAAAEFARMGARSQPTVEEGAEPGTFATLDSAARMGAELGPPADVPAYEAPQDEAAELAELRKYRDNVETWKEQFGAAFRTWRLCFIACDVIKPAPPGPDITPDRAAEFISRARMVDGIGYILDGGALGLENAASGAVRGILDGVQVAELDAKLARLREEQTSAPAGDLGRDLVAAHRELAQLQSELPERSEARATIALIMDPRAKLTRTDPAGHVTERDLREAPEVLARQLSVNDKVPPELVARAYEAAGVLIANRVARK